MTLVGFPAVTDADLMRLGNLNPGWSFERDDEGGIVVSPTSWQSGACSVAATQQLSAWAAAGAAGCVFDSSTGFRLSTNAVRSPDASWVRQERIDAARVSHPDDFFPGAPDIAIEIASASDQWSHLTAKITMYVREGSAYAVVIDPRQRRIFAAGTAPAGFVLDIDAIMCAGAHEA
jgi:Uma2 family endonuclease